MALGRYAFGAEMLYDKNFVMPRLIASKMLSRYKFHGGIVQAMPCPGHDQKARKAEIMGGQDREHGRRASTKHAVQAEKACP
jgi:hypothetical protein